MRWYANPDAHWEAAIGVADRLPGGLIVLPSGDPAGLGAEDAVLGAHGGRGR
jgi:hypothetical protein